jgi:hypothetical protein
MTRPLRHIVDGVFPALVIAAVVCGLAPAAHAHHGSHMLSVRSARCGWIEGDSLRDRSNLSEFCAQSIPARLRIRSATAVRERLWIEAAPDLAATLRGDKGSTTALLRTWLKQWRATSGYTAGTVSLLWNHAEFATVETTMTGEFVTIR